MSNQNYEDDLYDEEGIDDIDDNDDIDSPELDEEQIDVGDEGGFSEDELKSLYGVGEDDVDDVDIDDDEYDENKASDPVKKKVNDLTKKWRETQRELDEVKAAAASEASQRRDATQKQFEEEDKAKRKEFDARDKEIKDQIEKAKQDEDWEVLTDATYKANKLTEDKAEWRFKKRDAEQESQRAAAAGDQPELAEEAKNWVDRNKTWFLKGGTSYNSVRAKRAMRLAAKLRTDEGFDADDPELYERLDGILGSGRKKDGKNARFTDASGRQHIRRDDGSGGGRGPKRSTGNKRRITPTKRDWANMKKFQIDVTDKKAVQGYMRYKNG